MRTDLTVAICMYNAERYIAETLQCILGQTMQDFHLLIINDCSTDRSVEIVEQFFLGHLRQYELVHFSENKGLSAGRRYIEEHAHTRYILSVDADDCPYPAMVEKLYAKITSDADLMAVGCHLEYMDSMGNKMRGGIFLGETTKEAFYAKAAKEKLIFMQPTAIYDRVLALRVGGHQVDGFPLAKPRYQDLCEDLDLWTRMSDLYTEGKAIVVIPEVLCRYRKHEAALSSNSMGMLLRMRHIKTNLKRRRRGEGEWSFLDFRAQMTEGEYRRLERDVVAADALRSSYYCFRSWSLLKGLGDMIRSLLANPGYAWQKIRYNLYK